MTTEEFEDIIDRSGAFNGEPFASEEEVRDYMTVQNMESMFGRRKPCPWTQDQLDDAADRIIDEHLHWVVAPT